jgi:hypothetical protein
MSQQPPLRVEADRLVAYGKQYPLEGVFAASAATRSRWRPVAIVFAVVCLLPSAVAAYYQWQSAVFWYDLYTDKSAFSTSLRPPPPGDVVTAVITGTFRMSWSLAFIAGLAAYVWRHHGIALHYQAGEGEVVVVFVRVNPSDRNAIPGLVALIGERLTALRADLESRPAAD